MLSENDVVEAVCRYLESEGYRIVSRCSTKQHGEDIVAEHAQSGVTLRVEAKGETCDLPSSKRYGKPFNSAQCRDHVANAFYTAGAMLTKYPDDKNRFAMAFADTPLHRTYFSRIVCTIAVATVRLTVR
jgi:Holliday junction resolvase-like predicted endonuclease